MTRVLVLCGGTSAERAVSLRSGAAVQTALQAAEYDCAVFDTAQPVTAKVVADYDVVFPVLHGAGGEDGSIQAILETLQKPYIGSDVPASELCFDKSIYKVRLQQSGLPVPQGVVVAAGTLQDQPLISQPFVLKPHDGGSSVDTFIVREPTGVDWAVLNAALEKHGTMLLEELIEGTEITAGVLGSIALPIIEIIPPSDGEFDYENKYNGKTQELCPPQHVSPDVQASARDMALQIHELTGCRDFSRTDFIVTNSGALRVLETNTIPGMTAQSLLPKAAATAGISMPQLVDQLVQAALNR